MKAIGRHILVEYFDCDQNVLNNMEAVRSHMLEAAIISGATIVNHCFHQFSPHGISGVIVIAESHLTIHTWPEYNYAAVDLFTCGDKVDPWKGFAYLKEKLNSSHHSATELRRGIFDTCGKN